MNESLLRAVVDELRPLLEGRFLGKIFQLDATSFALDLGLRGQFLLVNVEPARPRFYLVERKIKELEKESRPLAFFGQALRNKLGGGAIVSLQKDRMDRIVRLDFRVEDDLGALQFRRLVVQLTGKSSNLFILDELDRIQTAVRQPKGAGQQVGEYYSPPPQSRNPKTLNKETTLTSPSAEADVLFRQLDAQRSFDSQASGVRSTLKKKIDQLQKLKSNLVKDLTERGDPETHKKIGDLLLANVANAVRSGNLVQIRDYFADDSPVIEVEVDEKSSLQEEAARLFKEYVKGKRAAEEIASRLVTIEKEIEGLAQRQKELELIIEKRDEAALGNFLHDKKKVSADRAKAKTKKIPGVRHYLSTDGFEILVGRSSKDNDYLTFKVAKSSDLWLHAGDFPGSHVIVRNPTRKEIPHRTVIEAAQLAARFSQAGEDSKVNVHYTPVKFLSKPKGVAAGLVRMSSFRSILVAPKEEIERLQ